MPVYLYVLLALLFGMWGKSSLLQICYILFCGYAIGYTLYSYIKNRGIKNALLSSKTNKYVIAFLYISLFYFMISYVNIPQLWNIKILDFDRSFIVRHFFFVYALFISVTIAISLYKHNIFYSISNKTLYAILLVCIIGAYIGDYNHILVALGIQTLTLIILKIKKKILIILIPIFFWGTNSTYAISACWIILCVLFPGFFTNFFKKHVVLKVIMVLISFIFICIFFNSFILSQIESDTNALWRLMVWSDEIRSLIKTYGLGVGFGSAYVTNEIYFFIDNPHMYDGEGGVFLVANHNSLLNVFYRLGIVGGLFFCLIIVSTLVWFGRVYNLLSINKIERKYIYWALINWLYNLIVICLNPGLESPRFATSYLFSLGCVWGLLLRYQRLKRKPSFSTQTTAGQVAS